MFKPFLITRSKMLNNFNLIIIGRLYLLVFSRLGLLFLDRLFRSPHTPGANCHVFTFHVLFLYYLLCTHS